MSCPKCKCSNCRTIWLPLVACSRCGYRYVLPRKATRATTMDEDEYLAAKRAAERREWDGEA